VLDITHISSQRERLNSDETRARACRFEMVSNARLASLQMRTEVKHVARINKAQNTSWFFIWYHPLKLLQVVDRPTVTLQAQTKVLYNLNLITMQLTYLVTLTTLFFTGLVAAIPGVVEMRAPAGELEELLEARTNHCANIAKIKRPNKYEKEG